MRRTKINSRAVFRHPFTLNGVPAPRPAGTYSIETKGRRRWIFPFSIETSSTTTIRIGINAGVNGSLHEFSIDPRDLSDALARDRAISAA